MADKKEVVDSWEKLGIGPTGMGQIPKLLDLLWHVSPKLTVCLVGETGIGKTPIVHQWCKRHNGFMRTLNFGHMTQEEVSMIMFTERGDTFDFIPPRWLVELNEEAEKKGLAVLFLDEWNRGDKAMVNALFTLTDERRIHNFTLHKNVLVVAAMNPSDGSYLVNEAEKDHAIRKRLNFVYCVHDLQAWVQYSKEAEFHPLVPAFIKAASTFLYDKGMRDAGKAFPCPSNWEKVSNILLAAGKARMELTDSAVRTLVEGQIGSTAADKFLRFVADQNSLIQPSEIIESYTLNSDVRKKVASLLNYRIDPQTHQFVKKDERKNSASIINELNRGLAIELFSSMPDVSKIARPLALYISDLPNELAMALAAQYLREERKNKGAQGEAYLNKLSQALGKFDQFKQKMKLINETHKNFQKNAESDD
jgi:hypothetical protein